MCSHLGPTTHVTLSIHFELYAVYTFCFVLMMSPKPWGFRLCNGIYQFSMSTNALIWFKMFGTTGWNIDY